jgi:cytochrome c-type biogenesis protein CcmH/NrfG
MNRNRQANASTYWSPAQAYIFAGIALLAGIALGFLIRGSISSSDAGGATSAVTTTAPSQSGPASGQQASSNVAEKVVPLLQELQTRPNDPALLADLGNAYYDGQQYKQAIDYYQRSLKLRPEDVNVRTDMGTAMWYSGDADGAIKQFEQSLKYQPGHAQTLFNMGMVKWQGKKDGPGALQSWETLLSKNPNYPDKQKVEQLIQQVKSGS